MARLSSTIQTGFRCQERFQRLAEEHPFTPAETESMAYGVWQREGQLYYVDGLELFPHGSGASQVPPRHRKPGPEVIRSWPARGPAE